MLKVKIIVLFAIALLCGCAANSENTICQLYENEVKTATANAVASLAEVTQAVDGAKLISDIDEIFKTNTDDFSIVLVSKVLLCYEAHLDYWLNLHKENVKNSFNRDVLNTVFFIRVNHIMCEQLIIAGRYCGVFKASLEAR